MIQIEKNNTDLLKNLPSNSRILDVGGASAPHNQASHLIDIVSYDKVKFENSKGPGQRKLLPKENYTQHDICSREPWPFQDKFFDFSICSHVLEDVRDPLWVCSELIRVSKAGYIEVPSKKYETTFGLEAKKLAGASHHRWIVDLSENKLRFTYKYFHVHLKYLNLNKAKYQNPQDNSWVYKFSWQDNFNFFENWLNSGREIMEYYLDKKISDREMWKYFSKIQGGGIVNFIKYLKNTNKFVFDIYKKIKHEKDIGNAG